MIENKALKENQLKKIQSKFDADLLKYIKLILMAMKSRPLLSFIPFKKRYIFRIKLAFVGRKALLQIQKINFSPGWGKLDFYKSNTWKLN